MFAEITKYFFDKKISEDILQRKSRLLLQEFDKVKSVGIVYDASDYKTIVKVRDVEVELKQKGKSVKVFAFIDSTEKKFEPFLFTRKDLNWYGYPTKQQLFDFANEEFDVLIGVYKNQTSPLNVIFANSKSRLRIGVNFGQDSNLFDIILGNSKVESTRDVLPVLINFLASVRTQ